MIRPMTTGRDFRSIGVIGLGTMGAGIAEIFARNGYQVVGVELNDESLERGRQHIQHSTDRAVKRGKLSEEDQAALVGRINLTTNLSDVKDCGLVVEQRDGQPLIRNVPVSDVRAGDAVVCGAHGVRVEMPPAVWKASSVPTGSGSSVSGSATSTATCGYGRAPRIPGLFPHG